MNKVDAIRTKIVATEAKLAEAETELAEAKTAADREMIFVYENKVIAYTNYLTELLKEKNLLSAGSGNLLSFQ